MENNLLFGTLPSAYEYNGRRYEMQTDFREWIKFDLLRKEAVACIRRKRRGRKKAVCHLLFQV